MYMETEYTIESEWEEGTRITVVIPDIIKTHSEKEGSEMCIRDR